VGTGDLTIEKILEEKKVFDASVGFEKLGTEDKGKGWRSLGMFFMVIWRPF
jgi:hypothetical protein